MGTARRGIAARAGEPQRARTPAFDAAYGEREATYLGPPGAPVRSIGELDRPGGRIAVAGRSAYDLYLARSLKHAELHRGKGLKGAFELFVGEGLEALAGLRPALIENAAALPGARVLAGCYTSVRQAIGARPGNAAGVAFLKAFVAEARESGLVARLIERHGVAGRLQVASEGG